MKSEEAPNPRKEAETVASNAEQSAGDSCAVVGVGASAGGLEAFSQLLRHIPPTSGMAFVLVQHLDPHHPSSLVELLGRTTSMPVMEVTDGVRIEENHVYVIPRNTAMRI